MNPALDGILAGVGHHRLAMNAESVQLAVSVFVVPAEVRVEPQQIDTSSFPFLSRSAYPEQERENHSRKKSFFVHQLIQFFLLQIYS